mmetsp:Transcript_103167/g.297102  ORF Transcript_103167/g.297102 Transcript_103167/m.297102 type:complete len:226 (-) Transcript_103167:98-775(-)
MRRPTAPRQAPSLRRRQRPRPSLSRLARSRPWPSRDPCRATAPGAACSSVASAWRAPCGKTRTTLRWRTAPSRSTSMGENTAMGAQCSPCCRQAPRTPRQKPARPKMRPMKAPASRRPPLRPRSPPSFGPSRTTTSCSLHNSAGAPASPARLGGPRLPDLPAGQARCHALRRHSPELCSSRQARRHTTAPPRICPPCAVGCRACSVRAAKHRGPSSPTQPPSARR